MFQNSQKWIFVRRKTCRHTKKQNLVLVRLIQWPKTYLGRIVKSFLPMLSATTFYVCFLQHEQQESCAGLFKLLLPILVLVLLLLIIIIISSNSSSSSMAPPFRAGRYVVFLPGVCLPVSLSVNHTCVHSIT